MLLAMLALCAGAPDAAGGAAGAAVSASMSAGFAPYRLGASATLLLGFRIGASAGRLPPPLTGVDLRFPINLGLATSELGTASCAIAPLQEHGPSICPPNSLMGAGTAHVEIPVGGGVQSETASLTVVAGPSKDGYVRPLVTATGLSPVIARIIIPSTLEPGELPLRVPLVESLPGAPDVSVTAANLSIGGHFTYYEHRGGKTIAYHPAGIGIPRSCPRGGFRFSATFSFQDGTQAEARTSVSCHGRR